MSTAKNITIKLLALLVCFVVSFATAKADNTVNAINYKGKAFWVGFLQSEVGPDPFELSLHITAEKKTTVTIRLEAATIDSREEKTWEQSYHVMPGVVTNITIPEEYTFKAKSGKTTHKGLYIEAEKEVMVIAKNSSGTSSDATVVIPIQSLGSEYYIMQYHVLQAKYPSQYLILATEDSTEVEITNKASSFDGGKPHQPYTIKLNKGETYMVQSRKDLTGSVVKEKAGKKIAVFSGITCTYVPKYCQSCDHLYEQILPTKYWGHEFALIPFDAREKYIVRILAKEDDTYVDVDGERYIIEKAGKYVELELKRDAYYVTSTRPVLVSQYTIGTRCDKRRGDPSMVLARPLLSFEGHTEFPAMQTENITRYYATVLVKMDDLDKLTVNGKNIQAEYLKLPYRSEYVYAHIEIEMGINKIDCDCKYNLTSYGFGWYESYAY